MWFFTLPSIFLFSAIRIPFHPTLLRWVCPGGTLRTAKHLLDGPGLLLGGGSHELGAAPELVGGPPHSRGAFPLFVSVSFLAPGTHTTTLGCLPVVVLLSFVVVGGKVHLLLLLKELSLGSMQLLSTPRYSALKCSVST